MENITLEAAVCATQLKEAQERLAAMERRYFRLRRYAKRWLVSLHGANVAIDDMVALRMAGYYEAGEKINVWARQLT